MTALYLLWSLRLALLCWYCALVAMGYPWWAVPLLVLFAFVGRFPAAPKPTAQAKAAP